MDDDPDDLAAAFFAQQAAKEKAKATLPKEDWIRVIEKASTTKSPANNAASSDDGKDANNSQSSTAALVKGGDDGIIDPSSWLVTTMPSAPEYHAMGNEKDGMVGIILDSSDTRCSLGKNNATLAAANDNACKEAQLSVAEQEMRRKLKEYLVQKLEEKMAKKEKI